MKNKILSLIVSAVLIFTPLQCEAKTPERLTRSGGVYWNEWGFKETWYNLDMSYCAEMFYDMGHSREEYPYAEWEDGTKRLGNYIMIAADLDYYPKGTILCTSLGSGIVVDCGTAIKGPRIDVAVTW